MSELLILISLLGGMAVGYLLGCTRRANDQGDEMTKQELEKEISQWEDEVSALVDELESARNHLNWLYEQQDKMKTS